MSSVDVRDIAAAATAALIDEVDADVFTLTGPKALTGAQMAAVLNEVTGRPIAYLDEPEDAGRGARGQRRARHQRLRCASSAPRCAPAISRPSPATSSGSPVARRSTSGQFARDFGWAFVPAARFRA